LSAISGGNGVSRIEVTGSLRIKSGAGTRIAPDSCSGAGQALGMTRGLSEILRGLVLFRRSPFGERGE
jgi:hypothetical protein